MATTSSDGRPWGLGLDSCLVMAWLHDAIVSHGAAIGLIPALLLLNRIWPRRGMQDAVAALSPLAILIWLAAAVVCLVHAAQSATWLPLVIWAVHLILAVAALLICSGRWTAHEAGQMGPRGLLASARRELRDWSNPLGLVALPQGAPTLVRLLCDLAYADGSLSPSEREIIFQKSDAWHVERARVLTWLEESKSNRSMALPRLRRTMSMWLSSNPPANQVRIVLNLIEQLVQGDGISDEKELVATRELRAQAEHYIQVDPDAMQYYVVAVPKDQEEFDRVLAACPGVAEAGSFSQDGIVLGVYHTRGIADAARESYEHLGVYISVEAIGAVDADGLGPDPVEPR